MFSCSEPHCTRSTADGYAIYRVSPKGPGQKFVGKCSEHAGYVDPQVKAVTSVFEDDNQGKIYV